MKDLICNSIGFKKDSFTCKYPSIHLEKWVRKTKIWNTILERIDKKIESWKGKWLTKVGRNSKIKAIILAIPTYQMLCLPLPKNINKRLEGKL